MGSRVVSGRKDACQIRSNSVVRVPSQPPTIPLTTHLESTRLQLVLFLFPQSKRSIAPVSARSAQGQHLRCLSQGRQLDEALVGAAAQEPGDAGRRRRGPRLHPDASAAMTSGEPGDAALARRRDPHAAHAAAVSVSFASDASRFSSLCESRGARGVGRHVDDSRVGLHRDAARDAR